MTRGQAQVGAARDDVVGVLVGLVEAGELELVVEELQAVHQHVPIADDLAQVDVNRVVLVSELGVQLPELRRGAFSRSTRRMPCAECSPKGNHPVKTIRPRRRLRRFATRDARALARARTARASRARTGTSISSSGWSSTTFMDPAFLALMVAAARPIRITEGRFLFVLGAGAADLPGGLDRELACASDPAKRTGENRRRRSGCEIRRQARPHEHVGDTPEPGAGQGWATQLPVPGAQGPAAPRRSSA